MTDLFRALGRSVTGPPKWRAPESWRRQGWYWPAVIGLIYLVICLAVLALEYVSEMSKLSRGSFTDTFSPFVGSLVLAWPASSFRGADWGCLCRDLPGYPDTNHFPAWEDALRDAIGPVVVVTLINTLVVMAVVWVIVQARRAARRRFLVAG